MKFLEYLSLILIVPSQTTFDNEKKSAQRPRLIATLPSTPRSFIFIHTRAHFNALSSGDPYAFFHVAFWKFRKLSSYRWAACACRMRVVCESKKRKLISELLLTCKQVTSKEEREEVEFNRWKSSAGKRFSPNQRRGVCGDSSDSDDRRNENSRKPQSRHDGTLQSRMCVP